MELHGDSASKLHGEWGLRHVITSMELQLTVEVRYVIGITDLTHMEELFWEYRASPSESIDSVITPLTPDSTLEDRDRLRRPKLLEPDDLVLLSRLAQANTLRRQHFALWRRHRDKNAKETSEALDQVDKVDYPTSAKIKVAQRYGPKTLAALSRPSTATQLLQRTTRRVENDDAISSTSARTIIPRATNAKDEDVQVPPLPDALREAVHNNSSFECPYCFIICPATLLQTEAWRLEILSTLFLYAV